MRSTPNFWPDGALPFLEGLPDAPLACSATSAALHMKLTTMSSTYCSARMAGWRGSWPCHISKMAMVYPLAMVLARPHPARADLWGSKVA